MRISACHESFDTLEHRFVAAGDMATALNVLSDGHAAIGLGVADDRETYRFEAVV